MNLKVIGCSVQGYSHKIHKPEPLPCQDAFDKEEIIKGTTMAVAVADGHGSSACLYSADGAALSARTFCEKMAELFQRYENDYAQLWAFLHRDGSMQIAQEIVETWRKRVIEKHNELGRAIPDQNETDPNNDWLRWKDIYHLYGTTLVGLFITPEFHYALQIGDGDITSIEDNHSMVVLEGDQILGVETHSLCEQAPWKHAHSRLIHVNDESDFAYILSSDGFKNSHASSREYFTSCEEYVETLRKNNPDEVEKALPEWLEETSEFGCGDDITVVIVDSKDQQYESFDRENETPEMHEFSDTDVHCLSEDKSLESSTCCDSSPDATTEEQPMSTQEQSVIQNPCDIDIVPTKKSQDDCLPVQNQEDCSEPAQNTVAEQLHNKSEDELSGTADNMAFASAISESPTQVQDPEQAQKMLSHEYSNSFCQLKEYKLDDVKLEPTPKLQHENYEDLFK